MRPNEVDHGISTARGGSQTKRPGANESNEPIVRGTRNRACSVCGADTHRSHSGRVLGKYDIAYWYCPRCGLLQTTNPFWLKEAYADAIALSDTGLLVRNIALSMRLTALLTTCFDRTSRFVDCGGGYGALTRLMRDIGFDFYWADPYCTNLFAQGFEADHTSTAFEAVTAFEVMEHIYDPVAFVRDTLAKYGSRSFVFSTQLFSGAPPDANWGYYSPETGQHISFYQRRTLRAMADKLSLNVYSSGWFHVFTDRTLSEALFRICAGRISFAIFPFLRAQLVSRTVQDRESALKRLRTLALSSDR